MQTSTSSSNSPLPGGEQVAGVAHAAADAVESAAGYVREHDAKSMFADVRKIVKNHPGLALLTAGALAFLISRMFSQN